MGLGERRVRWGDRDRGEGWVEERLGKGVDGGMGRDRSYGVGDEEGVVRGKLRLTRAEEERGRE